MVCPKKQAFWPRINMPPRKMFEKFLRVMTVCQKFGVILESKVVLKFYDRTDINQQLPEAKY